MRHLIKNVVDAESMLQYCAMNLGWRLDTSFLEDIDDVTYDFNAHDLGLNEDSFAKIKELRQLRPLVDNQPFGVFLVEFEDKELCVSALRRILKRLTPSKYGREYKTWKCNRIIFFCFWGPRNGRSIGIASFEESLNGSCSPLKIFYCIPSIEDESNLIEFERKLSLLRWPANPDNHDAWIDAWHRAFSLKYRQVVADTENLVTMLASIASRLKNDIVSTLGAEHEEGKLHKLRFHLREILGEIYAGNCFADMLAQAIVYGFLTARCFCDDTSRFTLEAALNYMPPTNPLLKDIIDKCCFSDEVDAIDLTLVNELVDMLNATNIESIVDDFNRQTSMGQKAEDPIVYFYEKFLECYNREQRIIMGEYFTPFPAANFMVRAAEYVLENLFNISSGYLDDRVAVLDPGVGTATCLRYIILRAHEKFLQDHTQDEWNTFVNSSLLPRLTGFDLMMTPYAIAHLKLALALKETGYSPQVGIRLGVYLNNSLKPCHASTNECSTKEAPITSLFTCEAKAAANIKKHPVQVVLGGPPFRENSWNKEPWIINLLQSYKKEPGTQEKLNEKNIRPLSNDYVKFIRFAEEKIKPNTNAVVAYLLPHTYIDNLTFRGMRWALLSAFSKIYILDLHGNALGQGKASDQNIFDIQQGVCITVFVKSPKEKEHLADVYYASVVGSRETKFDFLRTRSLAEIQWQKLTPVPPSYFMSPRGMRKNVTHIEWVSLAQLFPVSKVGVKTHNDEDLISMAKFDSPHDQLYAYRPFDTRHINYDRTKVVRDRYEVVKHFLGHRNLGIVIDRQVMADNWSHFQVVEHMIDNRLHFSRKGNPYLCPIYLFDESGKRFLNLDRALVEKFAIATGLVFSNVETEEPDKFDVLDLVDYSYAILFCNVFRHKFAARLSLDFPCVPLPPSRMSFRAFAEQGCKLRCLHAYGHKAPNDLSIVFVDRANCTVKNSKWEDNKVFINNRSYLYPIPEQVWDYCFGGYHGLQKWLKDRQGMTLTSEDIQHMINVFNIFAKSIEISRFIDSLSIEYFNGFESESIVAAYAFKSATNGDAEYTLSARQTEWRDAAHRPTGGFTDG